MKLLHHLHAILVRHGSGNSSLRAAHDSMINHDVERGTLWRTEAKGVSRAEFQPCSLNFRNAEGYLFAEALISDGGVGKVTSQDGCEHRCTVCVQMRILCCRIPLLFWAITQGKANIAFTTVLHVFSISHRRYNLRHFLHTPKPMAPLTMFEIHLTFIEVKCKRTRSHTHNMFSQLRIPYNPCHN